MGSLFALNPATGGKPIVVPPHGLRIGRAPHNDLVLADPLISREHALLTYEGDQLVLSDRGSRNGCFVNGRRTLAPTPLNSNDELRIGPHAWIVVPMAAGAPVYTKPAAVGRPQQQVSRALLIGGAGLLIVVVIVILALASTPRQTGEASVALARQRAFASTAFLVAPQSADESRLGSGSVIDAAGLVLTNFHVIEQGDTGYPVDRVIVFLSSRGDPSASPPDQKYWGEPDSWDAKLDLALLRIVADENGDPLPSQASFTSVLLGDSERIRTGDHLSILGFPTLGFLKAQVENIDEVTATLSDGIVSGFLKEDDIERAWIKTDAEINPGNSGGLALDAHWHLIGIPTAVSTGNVVSGKIGRLRPINLAKDLLAKVH
jgi:S1-C subfamily serine protease